MSLSYAKCFNDETENWENVPMLVWVSERLSQIKNNFYQGFRI